MGNVSDVTLRMVPEDYLQGVHDIQRIDRLLHRTHECNRVRAKFVDEVLFLANTNTMFACARSV